MDAERKKITLYYAIFFLSFFAALAPFVTASLIGMIALLFALIALYAARSKADEDSLLENHISYLIRTFWKTNVFLLMFSAIGITFFLLMMDFEASAFCLDYIQSRAMDLAGSDNMQDMKKVLAPCERVFMEKNKAQMAYTAIIVFTPCALYLFYRLISGAAYIRSSSYISLKRF